MSYSIVKHLEAASYNRILFYLDRGESDLPKIVDKTSIMPGSRAISQMTGREWFLDSNYEWKPVRDANCVNSYEYGGNPIDIEPDVDSVLISPKKFKANPNTEINFKAVVIGDNIIDDRIKWEVISGANDAKITQDGVLHIGNCQKITQIVVRATSFLNSSKYADAVISVDPFTSGIFGEVFGLELSPRQLYLQRGANYRFTCSFNAAGSYSKHVYFEVIGASGLLTTCNYIDLSDTTEAILHIDPDEKSSAIIVSAKYAFDPTIKDSVVVIIDDSEKNAPIVESLEAFPGVESGFGNLKPGDTLDLVARFLGKNTDNIRPMWRLLKQSSSTPGGSSYVSKDGTVYISEDEPIGNDFNIYCKPETTPGTADEWIYSGGIHVVDDSGYPVGSRVHSVTIIPSSAEVIRTRNMLFKAQVAGANLTDKRVKWSVKRNTSEFTKITQHGLLTVSSEEDSPAVIVMATSLQDNKIVGMAIVRVIKSEQDYEEGQYAPDIESDVADTYYVRGINNRGEKIWKRIQSGNLVEDVPEGFNEKAYVRVRKADGTAQWRGIIDTLEDAPIDVIGEAYVRKTNPEGENTWVPVSEVLELEKAIIAMTTAEWNALSPAERPDFVYITDSWYTPNIDPIIMDNDGHLF